MKKVMCFGTFDLLHPGHLSYLQQAKKLGDYLIVVLARDKTKQKMKKKTLFSEKERRFILKNLKIVDEVVLGDIQDHFKPIREKKPDVICLGYDHKIALAELKRKINPLSPLVKRMKPFRPFK